MAREALRGLHPPCEGGGWGRRDPGRSKASEKDGAQGGVGVQRQVKGSIGAFSQGAQLGAASLRRFGLMERLIEAEQHHQAFAHQRLVRAGARQVQGALRGGQGFGGVPLPLQVSCSDQAGPRLLGNFAGGPRRLRQALEQRPVGRPALGLGHQRLQLRLLNELRHAAGLRRLEGAPTGPQR